ncbi:GlxA family transcriptional regulator [Microbacterium flavum]|uniref:AraC family transcriptional regulator n=1 Tax=Microbacterium flavum TaxID=415216 RepID=A0ABS5XU37_9MICO|nr:AraC family transcriptional regulator [Microbacterium flavum]MBT8798050.1 AraC family transcriptional regulator [Microbacterium flavum]
MNAGRRKVGFLVFDGVKPLDFVGPAEVFSEANLTTDAYELRFYSPSGENVTTSMGLRIGVDGAAADSGPLDTAIIPGSEMAPAVFDDRSLREAIMRLAGQARRVASICSGAFGLAATGLLDGHSATTHWKFADVLAARYPRVAVDAERIFTRHGQIYTSAGVAAGIDLALSLVEEDLGADVARSVAQHLLVYMRRSGGQSQFSTALKLPAPRTRIAQAVASYISDDPTRPTSITTLAAHVNVSTRHLTRVIRDELGVTAAAYITSLRLELALNQLESGMTVAEAAAAAGFASASALRRAFHARYRTTPSEYQRRFRSSSEDRAPAL